MSATAFFYGSLCHPPLLAAVLGREAAVRPAWLPDHAVFWAAGRDFPLIVPEPGARAPGVLVEGLTGKDAARIDFYVGGFAGSAREMTVATEGGQATARVSFAGGGPWIRGAPWHLADWQARWGDIAVATAGDIMALFGQASAPAVAARRAVMQVRGAARVRAARDPAPATLRLALGPETVHVSARRQPYASFFAVEEYDLSWPRFGGGHGPAVTRAAFVSGDAVTVLPYDPVRDRVLLVEQFRAGPFARGDRHPWLLEAVAGRIDPGETPEDAARREAEEEAGLRMGDLLPVAAYYSTPGAKTEYLYSFVGLSDLRDGTAGVFGLADEAEDIRGHLVAFDALIGLIASGEVNNGPLILTALWLQRERGRLRAEAVGARDEAARGP